MKPTAKELIEAATHVRDSAQHEWDAFAVSDLARHILATVHPDDDEPVTRESCLAMGAKVFGHRRYGFDLPCERVLVVDMADPEALETEVYVADYDSRVSIKWSPTNHDLRRLVAALGE